MTHPPAMTAAAALKPLAPPSVSPAGPSRRLRRTAFVVGVLAAVAVLVTAGELFVRFFPPKDFQPYLGDENPQTGPYAPHPVFAAGYQSWGAFVADNREGFVRHPTFPHAPDGKPVWAMFGNSFVQAPGMLADTARVAAPDRHVFNLGRNEPIYVRFAQVALLLGHGLRPERIFVTLLPVEAQVLGDHNLDRVRPTARGAIGYDLPLPAGPAGDLIAATRLGRIGWVRGGWHQAIPGFNFKQVFRAVPESLMADYRRLFAGLAAVTARYGVPVTVVLIPAYEQIVQDPGFAFQDALGPELARLGLDVCDVRAVFVNHPNKPALFLPDRHFSPEGNAILFAAVTDHIRWAGVRSSP